MFKRLVQGLKGKPSGSEATLEPAEPQVAPADTTGKPDQLITAYDVHGREIRITRADWRDRMLLPQLEAKWNDPEALYGLIVNALNDEFIAEVEPASRRLLDTDPIIERSHVIRAIVLMKLGSLDEAERILMRAIGQVGETGTLLTNLAKVFDSKGDQDRADTTLWRALTLDPNQENGLGWWLARDQERNGEAGYVAALGKAAAIAGSWRPTLYLGRHWLAAGEVAQALELFRTVLASAASSGDALLTISGDLGNAGRITELVDLTEPHYEPSIHGPQVGFNLLQAYLELGRLDEGEALLDRLYALDMAPFKQHLDALAGQYQERRREATPARPLDQSELQIGHAMFELPIWMYGLRDPQWLFQSKPEGARRVTFLPLGKVMDPAGQAEEQREDDVGRLSRAVALYLAESAYEWTDVHGQVLLPVVMGGGPVVFPAQDEASQRETAAQLASNTDVLVQGAIDRSDDAWTISLYLWDTAALELIAQEAISADSAGLEAAVAELERRMLAHLGGARSRPHDDLYIRPGIEQMQSYLDALAQSLMLGLVATGMASRDGLWGERNMLEWPLRMALHWPDLEVPKAMYLSGISHAARYGSKLLGEFEERSFALLRDIQAARSPVADLAPLLFHAYGREEAMNEFKHATQDLDRHAWIKRVEE